MFSLLSRGASDRAVGPPKLETRASEKTRSLKPTPRSDFREPGAFGPKDLVNGFREQTAPPAIGPSAVRRSRPSMTARPAYCTFRAYLGRTPTPAERRTRRTEEAVYTTRSRRQISRNGTNLSEVKGSGPGPRRITTRARNVPPSIEPHPAGLRAPSSPGSIVIHAQPCCVVSETFIGHPGR